MSGARSARLDIELTAVSVQPAPGALVAQFLANQVQNCSLICPFVVQGAVQVPTAALLTPGAFVAQLQAGKPPVLTSKPDSGASPTSKQPNVMRGLGGAIKKALGDVSGKKSSTPDKPAKKATGD